MLVRDNGALPVCLSGNKRALKGGIRLGIMIGDRAHIYKGSLECKLRVKIISANQRLECAEAGKGLVHMQYGVAKAIAQQFSVR